MCTVNPLQQIDLTYTSKVGFGLRNESSTFIFDANFKNCEPREKELLGASCSPARLLPTLCTAISFWILLPL